MRLDGQESPLKRGHPLLHDVLNTFMAMITPKNLAMVGKTKPMALKTHEIVTTTARKAPDGQESPPKRGHSLLHDVLNTFIALKLLEILAMPSKSAPMALKTHEIVTATARKAPDGQESPPKRSHPLLRDALNTFMALKLLENLAMTSRMTLVGLVSDSKRNHEEM